MGTQTEHEWSLLYNGAMEDVAQQGLCHALDQLEAEQVVSGQVKLYQIYMHEKKEIKGSKTSSLFNSSSQSDS